ncbi:MAG: 2-oxoglutarate oxidoreductase [Gemmatimonadetes bacterium]|nr:2-oxoglutarate oxidoreductase [Gemmatimonadota bacterium]
MSCSLLHAAHEDERVFEMADYQGPQARWCSGCGDHSVLAAAQRLMTDEQLKPESTVVVSGIGCSSRFPHYMKTYGFHGIHGRALTVATGVKLTRPELDVFVVMGDGDCVSIGAAHWIHAVRYNMHMTVMMLDNNIYGLTKKQTSPTTPRGYKSNTQPQGSYLPPMNPLAATLGFTNASFVAQTAEWVPAHLFATLKAAHRHKGFAFVRILQRCPHFTPDLFTDAVKKPDLVEILTHPEGIVVEGLDKIYKTQVRHDPADIHHGRELAEDQTVIRLGLFFRDESRPRYEETRALQKRTAREKMALLNEDFDRYAV